MAWTERYASVAGGGAHDGTSEADAWTLAEAIAGVAAGHRVNLKVGTYASGATSRSFATAGTPTAPIWWRGYASTIGDLDAEPATPRVAGADFPLLTFTSGSATINGGYQRFSHLEFRGTAPGTRLVGGSGIHLRLDRVRVDNQEAGGTSYAVRLDGSGYVLARCWFRTASAIVAVLEERGVLLGCVLRGGGVGLLAGDGGAYVPAVLGCVFDAVGGHGIQFQNNGSATLVVAGCTFYGCGQDGVRIAAVPASGLVANCYFEACGGYGINNASGSAIAQVARVGNGFYANSSGKENGFGDSPSVAERVESSSALAGAAAHDFALTASSQARAGGQPGLFEGESYRSYLDVGAVQREEPAGGPGGPTYHAF